MPMHIREPAIDAIVPVAQFFMINAKLMQDRGVQIVTVRRIFYRAVRELVALAETRAAFKAAARNP